MHTLTIMSRTPPPEPELLNLSSVSAALPMASESVNHSRFLTLPLEVRLHIYDFCLPETVYVPGTTIFHNLTSTCHQFRDEILGHALTKHSLRLSLLEHHVETERGSRRSFRKVEYVFRILRLSQQLEGAAGCNHVGVAVSHWGFLQLICGNAMIAGQPLWERLCDLLSNANQFYLVVFEGPKDYAYPEKSTTIPYDAQFLGILDRQARWCQKLLSCSGKSGKWMWVRFVREPLTFVGPTNRELDDLAENLLPPGAPVDYDEMGPRRRTRTIMAQAKCLDPVRYHLLMETFGVFGQDFWQEIQDNADVEEALPPRFLLRRWELDQWKRIFAKGQGEWDAIGGRFKD